MTFWPKTELDAQPLYSFADATWDGEPLFYAKDYIRDVPLDQWRAQLAGRQFGAVPLFLSQLRWQTGAELEKATYGLATMLYLHDIAEPWSSYYQKNIFVPFEAVRTSFGVAEADVKFIPYWESNGAPYVGTTFKTGNSNVLVSGYTRLGLGKALLVVGNVGEADVTPTITVNFAALGVPAPASVTLYDGTTSQTVPVSGSRITVPLKSKRPAFITVN